MVDTNAARGIAFGADGLESSGPDVAGDERAVKRRTAAREEFHRFGDFDGGDEVHNGAENANRVTGFVKAGA